MKFALFSGNKIEATKGAKGACPGCGAELIAKCGDFKVNHWAHKGTRNCDRWWEPETEWHRSWKNNYSSDWQEVLMHDAANNELHIADVRTAEGLVLEFQHSYINPVEQAAREVFYKKMVWVVDCTRLKKDYQRFCQSTSRLRRTNHRTIFFVDFPNECFPSNWTGTSVPVIFDFKGIEIINNSKDLRNDLFCLLPKKDNKPAILVQLSRRGFVDVTRKGQWLSAIS